MAWQHPFSKSTITSRFGTTRNRTSPHRGLDYAPGAKKIIPSITAGEVTSIFYSSCLGWVCEVKENEHDIFIGYAHLYCSKHKTTNCDGSGHKDKSTCMSKLKVGDKVKKGQPVGRIGTSGTCSTGPHLHLTFSKETDPRFAKTFDPEKFIDQKIAAQKKAAKKKPEKPAKTKPEVKLPDATKKPPRAVMEALKVVLAWFTK